MKFILLPFSYLFASLVFLRNKLFDWGIFKSYTSNIPSIAIGNLQVGGSGKTPMTALLYKWYSEDKNTAILSRGYGRKTEGLQIANAEASPSSIGDEPYWYYEQLKAKVVVAEKRAIGFKYLEKEACELVLLDDAFQHRAVNCSVYMVLSDYNLPFFKDYPLPMGRLREWPIALKRAHILIYTKCPSTISEKEKLALKAKAKFVEHVFFSKIAYSRLRSFKGEVSYTQLNFKRVLAVSALAKPEAFITHCRTLCKEVISIKFPDHHDYTESDVTKILSELDADTIMVCTEKDEVKLKTEALYRLFPSDKVYILPIETEILFGEEEDLKRVIAKQLDR